MAETGEVGGYESSKVFADRYAQAMADAQSAKEQYEAHLIANGGPVGDKTVMGSLTDAGDGLSTAQAGFQSHRAALESHQQGAEYAKSKGDAAAETRYLGAE